MLPKITKINSSSTILLGLTLKATDLTSAGELNSSLNSPTSLKYPNMCTQITQKYQTYVHSITQNIKTYVHLKFKTPPKYKNFALKIIQSSKYHKIQNITNVHIGNITSKFCLLKTAYYASIYQISLSKLCTRGKCIGARYAHTTDTLHPAPSVNCI